MSRANQILVVDDNANNRDMLARRLERKGFEVEMAEDGTEALKKIAEGSYDLVLLDVMMPDISGLEVLKQVRCDRSPSELPIIMVTAKTGTEDTVNALELGANDYLSKPIDFPICMARIKTQLARKSAEMAVKESEERYALALAGTNDGLWDWDLRSGEIFYSKRWREILGYDPDEVEATPEAWFELIHPQDVERFRGEIASHLEGVTLSLNIECRIRHKSNTYRWTLVRGTSLRDDDGRAYRMAGSVSDITDHKVTEAVTGLPNRTLLVERLDGAIARAKRRSSYVFGLILIRIDGLESIRESFGHVACDQLLSSSAGRLVTATRPMDMVAILPENVFGILVDDVSDPEDPPRIFERVRGALEDAYRLDGEELFVTVTAGVTLSPTGYTSAEAVIRDATLALNKSREPGGPRFSVFDPQMHARALNRLRLETDLRKAITNNEFALHYQPIYRLPSQTLAGFEALLRWNHPERGMVSPVDFIPLAEETGLIEEIGLWALRDACLQLVEWSSAKPSDKPLFVSVNVSGKQLADQTFARMVSDVIMETGVDPATLKLEITETAVMDDLDGALDILNNLRGLDVRLALDDFGTGYSSLSLLQKLPVSTLKIDRGFVARMIDGEDGVQLVQAIITLAHGLGLDVIAEGVETATELSRLEEMGSEYAQGFFFAKPLPLGDATSIASDSQALPPAPELATA